MCPNDVWWVQSEVSGMYPLIFWHMPYAHVSSKVTVLLCLNGYQLCTWWCVNQLLFFKASLSNQTLGAIHVGMFTVLAFLICSEHLFFMLALFLAYKADIQVGQFVRGRRGAFKLDGHSISLLACFELIFWNFHCIGFVMHYAQISCLCCSMWRGLREV